MNTENRETKESTKFLIVLLISLILKIEIKILHWII